MAKAKDEGWSESIRWISICKAHLITGMHQSTKAGAFKLRELIEKQIEAGNVRHVSRGLYQFKLSLLHDADADAEQ
jgi:hypothetical protein